MNPLHRFGIALTTTKARRTMPRTDVTAEIAELRDDFPEAFATPESIEALAERLWGSTQFDGGPAVARAVVVALRRMALARRNPR